MKINLINVTLFDILDENVILYMGKHQESIFVVWLTVCLPMCLIKGYFLQLIAGFLLLLLACNFVVKY